MPDLWKILILVSASASSVAVAVALGVLRRLVNAVEHGHGPAEHGVPLDAGGIIVGAKLPDFELSEPVHEGTTAAPKSVPIYSLLTVPRIVVLTRDGCAGCETLIQALNDSPAPVSWMNIVIVIDPGSAVEELIESIQRRGVRILVQHDSAASIAFEHRASPHAFAVAPSGIVVDKLVTDDVDTLAAMAAEWLLLRPTTTGQDQSSKVTAQAQPGREVIR